MYTKTCRKKKKCDRPTNEWRHSGVYHRVKTQLTENKPLIVLYYTGETDRWKEPTNGSPIEMHSWRTHLKRYYPDCSNLLSYLNPFLVACYAALHPTMSVRWLVEQLVSRSVSWSWLTSNIAPAHPHVNGEAFLLYWLQFQLKAFSMFACLSIACQSIMIAQECVSVWGGGEVYALVLMYVCCKGYEIRYPEPLALCFPASICSKGTIFHAAYLL